MPHLDAVTFVFIVPAGIVAWETIKYTWSMWSDRHYTWITAQTRQEAGQMVAAVRGFDTDEGHVYLKVRAMWDTYSDPYFQVRVPNAMLEDVGRLESLRRFKAKIAEDVQRNKELVDND